MADPAVPTPQLPPELAEHGDPFGPIGTPPLVGETTAPEPTPDPASAPPVDPGRAALESQLAREREFLDAVMTRLPQQAPAPAAPEPRAPSGPMPNPAIDPDAFQEWYRADTEFREAQHRRALAEERQRNEQQTVAQSLWTEIRLDEDSRELARYPWLFTQAFQEMGGRIEGDPQAFKARVVGIVRERFESIRGGPLPPAGDPLPPPQLANRTAGLSGGSAPGGAAPPRKAPSSGKETVDMVDELHRIQREDPHGYFA